MARKVIGTKHAGNLAELQEALKVLSVAADPETVYLEDNSGAIGFVLHLVEHILTDGSIVYTILVRPTVTL